MIDAGLAVVLATDFNPGFISNTVDPDDSFVSRDAYEDDTG